MMYSGSSTLTAAGVNMVRFDQDQIQNSGRIHYAEACRRKYGGKDAWRAAVGWTTR